MDLYNRLELGDIRNVNEEEQEKYFYTPIYQILPLEYAISILQNRVLRFNSVFKYWEDPYELFLFKQNIFIEGTPFHINDYDKKLYGQCWSLNKDTDAMWRIYSSKKKGVRIKTTIGKMIQVLDQTRGMNWTAPAFGLVKYVDIKFIKEYLRQIEKDGSGKFFEMMSDSLFYKREQFSHEKEVRFIIQTEGVDGFQYNDGDFLNLKIDPTELIEEISLDPRLDANDVTRLTSELRDLNIHIPISQSDLYKFEPLHMDIIHTPMHVENALEKYYKRSTDL